MYAPLIGFCEDCAVSCARVKLVRHLDHVSVLLTSHADFTICKQFFFYFSGLGKFSAYLRPFHGFDGVFIYTTILS